MRSIAAPPETRISRHQDWNFPNELAAVIDTHHDEPVPGEISLYNLVKVSWRLSDALGYAAFSPSKLDCWEDLIAFLPNANSSWLGTSLEVARAGGFKRLTAAPL